MMRYVFAWLLFAFSAVATFAILSVGDSPTCQVDASCLQSGFVLAIIVVVAVSLAREFSGL